MTEAKHTPGPWSVQDGTTTGKVVVALAEPKVRRSVAACGGQRRDENARLIAAAPELLAAVKRLGWRLREHVPADDPALLDALDVIAKAESRP